MADCHVGLVFDTPKEISTHKVAYVQNHVKSITGDDTYETQNH